jgi:hypothetical protein
MITSHYPHHVLSDIIFFFFRNSLTVLDVLEGLAHTISLPINLRTVFLVAEDKWLLVENETNQWVNLRVSSLVNQAEAQPHLPWLSRLICVSVLVSLSK